MQYRVQERPPRASSQADETDPNYVSTAKGTKGRCSMTPLVPFKY